MNLSSEQEKFGAADVRVHTERSRAGSAEKASGPEKASGKVRILRLERGWGYCLMRDDGRDRMRAQGEVLARGVSLVCFAGILGLWLWPGSNFSLAVLGIKAGLSIALGVAGLALGHLSERGLAREVQVDLKRDQLRLAWRNRKGDTRLITVIGFAEVGSVFLRRLAGGGRLAQLNLRYGRFGEVVTLFSGEESLMREVWHDLNGDLHPHDLALSEPLRVKPGPSLRGKTLSRT